MAADFIHLHVHSAFSLAEGAIPVKDLVKLCVKAEMPAVAVTDSGNLFGAMEFASEAAKAGVQPIIGTQLRIRGEEGTGELVLLVQSDAGYRNLCHLVSQSFLETESTEAPHITWDRLDGQTEGLICLTGGARGPVARHLIDHRAEEAARALSRLEQAFPGRLYIELQRHGLPEEAACEEALIDLAYERNLPLVATNNAYFAKREMQPAHDALLCIADGRFISEESRRRETEHHYFRSAAEMRELFADLPEACDNTLLIARRCHYLLKSIAPILPPFPSADGRSEIEELKAQSREGLDWRLENFVFTEDMDEAARTETAQPYRDRLEFELDTIIQMGFPGYFLIVSDFIKWAKQHNIPVGPGRGSGAGSVVAWALKITDLDPLRFNLLFERFLNPERVSMPDFDVDFCQERRDEVIRYVQDRYGHDRVAQIITFGKLQARAVVRDVGRVLQLSYGQVDRIAKMIPNNPADPITLEEALERDADLRAEIAKEEATQHLVNIALKLEGLYRHASTHAAGVVIGDRPLSDLVPLYRDPRSTMPVTQFNMKYVEQAGLVKFDFLGLKTMTVIQKAVEIASAVSGQEIDILKVPLDDAATYKMLSRGDTVGVFQLESAGMRDTLRKLKPNRFEDIIALVALYRPGPMDNIPRYIAVKEGKEEADYLHPVLEPILTETYGIMVYQEQVMQAAQRLSGYTLGGADLLRRAMGKKIKEEMDAQRALFVAGAAKHNAVPEDQASAIFDQIAKFAGYGFNKSHAAAYALVAYWTGWLKANHPVAFMAASMTLDMGNTDKLAIFKQALDRMGIALLPPDVNASYPDFTVENGAIRYALGALKGVGRAAMDSLVEERGRAGPYASMADFAARIDHKALNRRQLEVLAAAGAFESLEKSRARAHASSELLLRHAQSLAQERESGQTSLFGAPDPKAASGGGGLGLPDLPQVQEWDHLERLSEEFSAVGFYLSAHPLDTKKAQMQRLGIARFADLTDILAASASAQLQMAGVLIKKQEKMSKSGNKFAFLQLSDASGVFEATLFSETLSRARSWLEPGNALLMNVVVESREDQIRLTIQDVQPLDEALAGKLREVHIRLTSPSALPTLRQLLDREGRGPAQIQLHIPLDGGRIAKIALPGYHAFPPATRQTLSRLDGIAAISEV